MRPESSLVGSCQPTVCLETRMITHTPGRLYSRLSREQGGEAGGGHTTRVVAFGEIHIGEMFL